MDPNTLANTVLIASAALLVAAIAYRVGSSLFFPRRRETLEEAEALEPISAKPAHEEELEEGEEPTIEVPAEAPARVPGPSLTASEMIKQVAEEQWNAILESADNLVDYAVARGGVSHIRPETLRKLAIQFSLLEATLRKASSVSLEAGELPEKMMRDTFREGFRLLASQVRK